VLHLEKGQLVEQAQMAGVPSVLAVRGDGETSRLEDTPRSFHHN